MNKWQQQVYDMLRAAGRNNLPCTIPADVTHIPANMMLEADKAKWISVEERLPENFDTVIIWRNDCCNACIGWLIDDRWSVPKGVKVTHWMPLPEPPKEE